MIRIMEGKSVSCNTKGDAKDKERRKVTDEEKELQCEWKKKYIYHRTCIAETIGSGIGAWM